MLKRQFENEFRSYDGHIPGAICGGIDNMDLLGESTLWPSMTPASCLLRKLESQYSLLVQLIVFHHASLFRCFWIAVSNDTTTHSPR